MLNKRLTFRGKMVILLMGLFLISSTLKASVTHVWPESGTNDTIITGHIFGLGFSGTPTVKLVKSGLPEITGINVNVISGTYLTCDLDLASVDLGTYTLTVNTDTLDMCFTINNRFTELWFWDRTDMGGDGDRILGVAVGDGNNDGQMEVYGACLDNHIYQFKWNGTGWDKTDIGAGGMNEVAVGDGNNDGHMEVYGADGNNHIHQFKWNGTSWDNTDMGSGGSGMLGVAVGDGNNDGQMEVYGGSNHIYQFKWNGTFWDMTDMGSGASGMNGVAVGDGNNDGQIEVYGVNIDSHIYQFKWNGTFWDMTDMGSCASGMNGVAVGDGNNDGKMEVYCTGGDNHIYQFKWNGTDWDKADMGAGQGWGVAVGDGDNDGYREVYGACLDNHIYQFKWNGIGWDKTDMGAGGGMMIGVVVGDGNNDGQMEVYGACYDNHIHQFRTKLYQNIFLSDTSHNFGNVSPENYILWQYLYLKNSGELVLHIDSIVSSDSLFSILDALPDSLSPGDSIDLTVQFKPLSEGIYQGTLSFYSDDPDDSIKYVYLEGMCDTTEPVIESTTVWNDTSFAGPFPVYTKITDENGIDSVRLYYRRAEDPNWIDIAMSDSGSGWYYNEIPEVSVSGDSVKYYIYGIDIADNESTDPAGAPGNYYSFIANMTGMEELSTRPQRFEFSVNIPAKEKVIFRFSIPEKCNVRLEIYDVTGRLIKQFSNLTIQPFGQTVWDGRDDAGRQVPAGVYFVDFRAGNYKKTEKAILLR